jgi:hypothetical protein
VTSPASVLIVGASAAGLSTAEALRRHGYGRRLTLLDADRPYTPVPYFWTDQYDVRIQAYGLPSPAAEMTIAEGDVAQGRFAALYREDGRVTAVLGWNMPKQARLLRQRLLGSPPAPHPLAPA